MAVCSGRHIGARKGGTCGKSESSAARCGRGTPPDGLHATVEADAALLSYNYAVEETAFRAAALEAADRSLELIEIRYREGAESLLSLIDAQRQTLSAQDGEIQSRYEALRRRVGVYNAFGG